MATISQIRGMLLEEAVMHLLRMSGYQTVEETGSDPTLRNGRSGLEVMGRGGAHQIDAIGDFSLTIPFSYPQRLLVEAKCYSDSYPVGMEVIRNAVGVLKDVGEFWVSHGITPGRSRYNYQFALFSASGYTNDAERYAYAQDVYLIPLAKSEFVQHIIQAIRRLTFRSFGAASWNTIEVSMRGLRRAIRSTIRETSDIHISEVVLSAGAASLLEDFCLATRRLEGALLAMIAKSFPVFLVPNRDAIISDLEYAHWVRIYWDDKSWYLVSARDEKNLFSFDLPLELFNLYATQGVLSRSRALDLKAEVLNEIQAILTVNNRFRVITFHLDQDWLSRLRNTHPKLRNRGSSLES